MNNREQDSGFVSAREDLPSGTHSPEAIEAASVRSWHHGGRINPISYRGRGVEWVRPTDLIARGGSRLAGAGISFQTELRRRTYEATATTARSIAKRARHLPPLSAFGHGSARRGAERAAIGTV